MKKVLIFLVVLIVLVVGGAAVFLATFDADRYKGVIIETLEKSLGEKVSIGHIGLGWRGGLAFEISNLAISPDELAQRTPGIKLESASAQIRLLPLLKKDVQITSFRLDRPSIKAERLSDGTLLLGGIDFSKKTGSAPAPGGAAGGAEKTPFKFSVDSIRIRDGNFAFIDRTGALAAPVEVNDLDLDVKNFSLTEPFSFEAAASVFGRGQNVKLSGRARIGKDGAATQIENFVVRTDLSELDTAKLSALLPALRELKSRPEGLLTAEVEYLELAPGALATAKGRMTLKKGKLAFAAMESPVEDIDLAASFAHYEAVVDHLSARTAGGQIKLAGKVSGLDADPVLTLRGSAAGLSLAELVRAANPDAPQLNGHVNVDFEGQAQGLAWQSISRTLNGRARVRMDDGVLLNYNLLRELISKISMIPGAESAFQTNFPQIYQQRMNERSTVLRPLDLQARIVNGIFVFQELRIDTDYALINGAGQVGLDRRLDVRANLIVNQEISRAAAGAFNPVQLLFNNAGEIVIPLTMQGMLPQIRVLPDTQYVAQKLLSGKAQEFIQGFVNDPSKLGNIEDILKKNLKNII